MTGREELLRECAQLRRQMEDDLAAVGRALQGEAFDAYRELVARELQMLDEVEQRLRGSPGL